MNETQLRVRIARPVDIEPVRTFVAGLSQQTRYLRFFSPISHLSAQVAGQLVAVNPRQLVLLALDGDVVVGHAMATCVGDRLVRKLVDVVGRFGVDQIQFEVLSQNSVVLTWMRRRLPDVRLAWSGTTVTARGYVGAPAA